MFVIIAAGLILIVALAIVVGVVEHVRAPIWRDVAAERRARWEAWVDSLEDPNRGAM